MPAMKSSGSGKKNMRDELIKGASVYSPLYSPEGGPVSGFSCKQCLAVTRTHRGMILHLNVCHGLRLQTTFSEVDRSFARHEDLPVLRVPVQ